MEPLEHFILQCVVYLTFWESALLIWFDIISVFATAVDSADKIFTDVGNSKFLVLFSSFRPVVP